MAYSATSIDSSSKGQTLNFTTFSNVIDGQLVKTTNVLHGVNPATKEPLWDVPVTTQADLDTAVNAAQKAFKTWSRVPLEERKAALEAFAVALDKHTKDFSRLLTIEQGKPSFLATAEADAGPIWIRGLSALNFGEEVVDDNEDRTVITRHTPLGVVGAIVPWNFPIQLAIGKIAPAVLTGNTIIVKPSPFTPYCGLKLVELAQQFFPPGVVQALSGGDELGPWIVAHPGISKISFTGSTATGKKIMESASKTLKRITLELGGKDPAIICKDVDIPTVSQKIAQVSFLNSGQICVALKRVYIHESIYSEFRDAMVAATKKLQVGDGLQEGVFMGPIQNQMQYDRVRGFFDDIEKQGQKVLVGGTVEQSKGYFINPTIIDNPDANSRLVREEPFGKS